MCLSRILALLRYWQTSPPAHDILALRYLGPPEKRSAGSAHPQNGIAADSAETVSQIPQIAVALGVPVRSMSEKTRALYEYAQSVINSKAAGDSHAQ
jgi:hypothetical protein